MYCNILPWNIITEKKTKRTPKSICKLNVALQLANSASMMQAEVTEMDYKFIFLCEKRSNSEDTGID
jgi:hypothetical protein